MNYQPRPVVQQETILVGNLLIHGIRHHFHGIQYRKEGNEIELLNTQLQSATTA